MVAMATYKQNKFRRDGIPNMFTNLLTPKHDTKTEPDKYKIYDGSGRRYIKQIQKTEEIPNFTNRSP